MVNGRNRSVDAVKGILIFLVVIGHVLLGTLDENVIRYTIYSFHMPAFFFVSGYLLDMDRLAGQGYWNILSKYWKRMLAEWSVAWLVYTAYVLRHGNFDWMDVVQNLYAPFYHLWFVPALFVLITLLWLVFRLIKCNTIRFIQLFALGLLTYNISNTSFNISSVFNCSLMLFIVMGVYSRKYLNVINITGGGNNTFLHFINSMCVSVLEIQNRIYENLYRDSNSGHTLPVGDSSNATARQVSRGNIRILGA